MIAQKQQLTCGSAGFAEDDRCLLEVGVALIPGLLLACEVRLVVVGAAISGSGVEIRSIGWSKRWCV